MKAKLFSAISLSKRDKQIALQRKPETARFCEFSQKHSKTPGKSPMVNLIY